MPHKTPFRVVIFSSARARDIGRLVCRIHEEVPDARVVGVLREQRPGKPLKQRVARFLRNLHDPAFIEYAVSRILHAVVGLLLSAGDAILRFVHAGGIREEAEHPLENICRSVGCGLLVTTDYHSAESLEFVKSLEPDLGIVYGTRILKPALFTLPRQGSINIHKRKVPDYRGGGPVGLWEILDGKTEIGITVHEVVEKLDAGAIINSATIPIETFDTLDSLALKAHVTGTDLLVRSVADFACGTVRRRIQQGEGRMFRNPSPQQLHVYQKKIAASRPRFHAVRSRSFINLVLRTLLALPIVTLRNWIRRMRGKFPVEILFHHIVTDRPHSLGIPTDIFLRHVQFLRKFYRIVSLSQAVEMLKTDRVHSPMAVLTFDDGYADNFLTLRAIREQMDVPMTLFVSTDHVATGGEFAHDLSRNCAGFSPLTWEQLRRLQREGFEIGSHTRTHFDCGSVNREQLQLELLGSRRDIEKNLNCHVEFFSFPFGLPENISHKAMSLACKTYACVFSAYGGSNFGFPNRKINHLQRWPHSNDLWELALKLQSFLDAAPKPSHDIDASALDFPALDQC